ncbi:leucine-rich repeat domain-containing protein [Oceanispirochaeta sp.]|uniref:leucine-rich repeat domain-containing protein n=1 Tax=Oceanispirochaeta sp. TaxID=2035350 RepID=UPI00345D0251
MSFRIDSVFYLKGLRTLDLSFNEIEDVRVLNELPKLEYVNLIVNRHLSRRDIILLEERYPVLSEL